MAFLMPLLQCQLRLSKSKFELSPTSPFSVSRTDVPKATSMDILLEINVLIDTHLGRFLFVQCFFEENGLFKLFDVFDSKLTISRLPVKSEVSDVILYPLVSDVNITNI